MYSTYLGGSGEDGANAITVDSSGNVYVTGSANSTDFSVTSGVFQTTSAGGYDVFVTKINSAGKALVYSAYLGGSGNDASSGIAADSAGDVYVTGSTSSTNFPITPGAFQTVCGNPSSCLNAFVTEINPTGSALVYSTYLGGSGNDMGSGIAVDNADDAYVTGWTRSANFPVTAGAFQTTNGGGDIQCPYCDAFVTEINPTGSALVYSTYLGGSGNDIGSGIAVDSAGNAYVVGQTCSTNFPVTPGAFQTSILEGDCEAVRNNAFVTKINSTGSALVYSTYLGGSVNDFGKGIALDSSNNAYVTGYTGSADFPVTPGAFQTTCGGGCSSGYNAFVSKLNPSGSALAYSSYLGGSRTDGGAGIAVDGTGNAYVTGDAGSADFPITPPPLSTSSGGTAFVSKLNPAGSALVYSTYLGSAVSEGNGIAVDSLGNTYAAGFTTSTNFPTTNPLQPTLHGADAFVAKISADPSGVILLPIHLDFSGIGTQPVGVASSPQVSTLINATSSTLSTTSVNVVGANSGDFAQANNCGGSVPPGGSCSITVTFTPTATGSRVAAVSIADSDPSSPQSLSLTGVGLPDTVTKLTSSANPALLGKSVTFMVTVSSPSGGTPTGQIIFLDGETIFAIVSLSGGVAKVSTKNLPLGLNVITASYGGDSNYGYSASAPVNLKVGYATTTTLSSSSSPSAYGQAVTFSALVSSSGSTPTNGDTVSFMNGTTALGTAPLTGGSASFTTPTLKVGTALVTAVYAGGTDFLGSKSGVLKQVVGKATTLTTLTSSPNPSAVKQAVTFTATVAPEYSGTPTGKVTFYDGTKKLGIGTLSGGAATLTTTKLAAGTHNITATYGGSTNFVGSRSAPLTQTVN